jgi:predicted enzyme related to lactoylglutathione lyase
MTDLAQAYLLTTDLDRARAFYEAGLDLDPSRVGDTSVAYETGGCELKVQADFDPAELASFGLEPPPATGRGEGAIHVLETEADLDTLHRQARTTTETVGGEVLSEPRDVPWGGRMFLVRSPDGYTFEVRRAGEE